MNHWFYLMSTLLFCVPILALLYTLWGRILMRYGRVLLVMLCLSLVLGTSDYFAIRWQVWDFNPASSFNIRPLGELESYIFSAGVTLCLASITLLLARHIDSRRTRGKRMQKSKRHV